MFINPLPRIAKRDLLTISLIPIIALLVIVLIGFARFFLIRSRRARLGQTAEAGGPQQSVHQARTTPPSNRRTNDVELEYPPPPPYQPDKLPAYVDPEGRSEGEAGNGDVGAEYGDERGARTEGEGEREAGSDGDTNRESAAESETPGAGSSGDVPDYTGSSGGNLDSHINHEEEDLGDFYRGNVAPQTGSSLTGQEEPLDTVSPSIRVAVPAPAVTRETRA